MKLCMFSPVEMDLERGWPGRIEGDTVIQLAAQTLQAFFTGGGEAREHAVFPLADVVFRAPVLHPPSVRIFDGQSNFRFANPAAIINPDAEVAVPSAVPTSRDAAIIGADGAIAGFTPFIEWTAPDFADLSGEKARDFALTLGPIVTTIDEAVQADDDYWHFIVWLSAENTRLYPGDIIAW
jgi:hypothetical protein